MICGWLHECWGYPKVYHHDAIAKEQCMSPKGRLGFHQKKSGHLMDELENWMETELREKRVEPNSGMGKAFEYMLKRWEKLTRFLTVAGAPLDNNICYAASGITDIMPTAGLCRVVDPEV